MENNYRAVTGISAYVFKDAIGSEVAVIVAGDNVIHYYIITLFDCSRLIPPHQSVWRTEKVAANQLVGQCNVVGICPKR